MYIYTTFKHIHSLSSLLHECVVVLQSLIRCIIVSKPKASCIVSCTHTQTPCLSCNNCRYCVWGNVSAWNEQKERESEWVEYHLGGEYYLIIFNEWHNHGGKIPKNGWKYGIRVYDAVWIGLTLLNGVYDTTKRESARVYLYVWHQQPDRVQTTWMTKVLIVFEGKTHADRLPFWTVIFGWGSTHRTQWYHLRCWRIHIIHITHFMNKFLYCWTVISSTKAIALCKVKLWNYLINFPTDKFKNCWNRYSKQSLLHLNTFIWTFETRSIAIECLNKPIECVPWRKLHTIKVQVTICWEFDWETISNGSTY